MQHGKSDTTAVRGMLLDLGGVVYTGDTPIGGALGAIERLRQAGLPFRFITNTTRRSRRQVVADLARMGLTVSGDELLTPAMLARGYLEKHELTPFLVVHPGLKEDFSGLAAGGAEAVVIGDAGEHFTYARLNEAFRKIAAGAEFLALAMNRNFKDADGGLSLDAGPFVAALEYASRRKATLFGKPSPAFYRLAVASLGLPPGDVAMVGDDAEADVGGAMASGLQGILVRTGKYHEGDELALETEPHFIADDLSAAVGWALGERV